MAVSGVLLVRRWLVWTAVTLATMWRALLPRWRWRGVLVLTAVVIAGLGSVATLDLLDVVAVLPWMGDRPWWVELVTGAVAAVAVPALLSLTWGRFRTAGLIGGVALALLLHVTVAVMAVYGVYRLLELALCVSTPPVTSRFDLRPVRPERLVGQARPAGRARPHGPRGPRDADDQREVPRTVLTMTENAQTLVRDLADQAEVADTGGVRIARPRQPASSSCPSPPPRSPVTPSSTADGARLFLEEQTATLLADATLDTQDGEQPGFVLTQQDG